MFTADSFVFFFDGSLCGFLFRACIVKLCLSKFFRHALLDDLRLLLKLFAEHLQVLYGLLVENNHTLAGFGFGGLRDLAVLRIDLVLIDQDRFTEVCLAAREVMLRIVKLLTSEVSAEVSGTLNFILCKARYFAVASVATSLAGMQDNFGD